MSLYQSVLQSAKERDTIPDIGELSLAEKQVILAMRKLPTNNTLPMFVIQWVGNAWKIYEAKLTNYTR